MRISISLSSAQSILPVLRDGGLRRFAWTPVMFRSWPNNLSGPLVVVEKPAQSLVPAHPAGPVSCRRARNQDVPETLMIPLAVVMGYVTPLSLAAFRTLSTFSSNENSGVWHADDDQPLFFVPRGPGADVSAAWTLASESIRPGRETHRWRPRSSW
jgi:hypothetical protein